MERRMRRKSHVRCEAGENLEITSKDYLSLLNIYTKNSKYNEQKGLLRNVRRNDLNSAPWMNVRMPYEPQSLTIKEREFQKIKEIVARELGEELYCKTILD